MNDKIYKWQHKIMPLRSSNNIDWKIINGWRNKLMKKFGMNASYHIRGDCICIPQYLLSMSSDKMYAPTITHELTHAAQRVRYGVILYLFFKTFMRWKLENEAVAEEKRAQLILKVHVLE